MQTATDPILRLGDEAPDFTAETSVGKLRFHEWMGDSWCVLFSHPRDFTPVCTTELGYTSKIAPEFEKRNVKVISLSVDDLNSHTKWIKDINETQHTSVKFPLIADSDKHISHLYGMIHPKASDTVTVRTVFLIDPKKKIRMMLTYPPSTGRNFDEILRVIDSIQLTDSHQVATPVNWNKGDDVVILPKITDAAELKRLFPKGYEEVTPYLRLTPDPKK